MIGGAFTEVTQPYGLVTSKHEADQSFTPSAACTIEDATSAIMGLMMSFSTSMQPGDQALSALPGGVWAGTQ